jgi:multicomponent Na+:H+ antiporter subunit F
MSADLFLFVSESIALGLLTLAFVLALVRLVSGPTLADRIVALDLVGLLVISLVGVIAMRTGVANEVDIALGLCVVAFVATTALARYLLQRRTGSQSIDDSRDSTGSTAP